MDFESVLSEVSLMEYIGDFFYHLQVILASGYYAVFKVNLIAKELEGIHDGAVQIIIDYEVYLLYNKWMLPKRDVQSLSGVVDRP